MMATPTASAIPSASTVDPVKAAAALRPPLTATPTFVPPMSDFARFVPLINATRAAVERQDVDAFIELFAVSRSGSFAGSRMVEFARHNGQGSDSGHNITMTEDNARAFLADPRPVPLYIGRAHPGCGGCSTATGVVVSGLRARTFQVRPMVGQDLSESEYQMRSDTALLGFHYYDSDPGTPRIILIDPTGGFERIADLPAR